MQDIEKIYEEYFVTLNKYLFCLTHNNDLSEELTQETFYRAVKKKDTLHYVELAHEQEQLSWVFCYP